MQEPALGIASVNSERLLSLRRIAVAAMTIALGLATPAAVAIAAKGKKKPITGAVSASETPRISPTLSEFAASR